MANPRYLRPGFKFCLSHAIEECGEFLAAAGKTQRWGAQSVNPELAPRDQERNVDWLRREMRDVRGALDRLLIAIREEYPDPLLDRAEQTQREVDEQKEIVVRMRKLNSKVIAERDAFQAAMQIAISLAYRASRDLYRGSPRNPDYDREADITAQIDKMCRDYPLPKGFTDDGEIKP